MFLLPKTFKLFGYQYTLLMKVIPGTCIKLDIYVFIRDVVLNLQSSIFQKCRDDLENEHGTLSERDLKALTMLIANESCD